MMGILHNVITNVIYVQGMHCIQPIAETEGTDQICWHSQKEHMDVSNAANEQFGQQCSLTKQWPRKSERKGPQLVFHS